MWNLFSCHRIKFSSLVARNVGDISTDVLDDVRGSISRNVVQGDVRLVDLATYGDYCCSWIHAECEYFMIEE